MHFVVMLDSCPFFSFPTPCQSFAGWVVGYRLVEGITPWRGRFRRGGESGWLRCRVMCYEGVTLWQAKDGEMVEME